MRGHGSQRISHKINIRHTGQLKKRKSSKTAPIIKFFSIVLGAEYLSYVKSIATFALTIFGYIFSVLASVCSCVLRCAQWRHLAWA